MKKPNRTRKCPQCLGDMYKRVLDDGTVTYGCFECTPTDGRIDVKRLEAKDVLHAAGLLALLLLPPVALWPL